MTELLEWMIVIGLAVAIVGIFSLSNQIERHTRQTLDLMLQSNAMIVAQLERADGASLGVPGPRVGAVRERRYGERRATPAQMQHAAHAPERRAAPDRRRQGSLLR